MLTGKRILLIVGGGIAAYKCLDLVRRLRERGASVCPVMTASAKNFVTPMSLSALCEDTVYSDLFNLTDESEMGHIQLSRQSDLIVVAPATANLLARMAHGLASDLASTVLLATDTPVLVAPSMNVRMWTHPATQRNVAQLRQDGISFVGPDDGDMACGEYGPGRMAEPLAIVDAVADALSLKAGPLAGRHVVITSGPTHEPIDPVRYIANRSSGKQGHAIAAAAAKAGARVTLVSGPVAIADPAGCDVVKVETARQMKAAVEAAMPADIAIMAAAVADWRAADEVENKIKKDGSGDIPDLALTENPDILAAVGKAKKGRPALVIGFAAETDDLVANGRKKLKRKGADWIVANDVSAEFGVMGGDTNTIRLISSHGVEKWPLMKKADVAQRLIQKIGETLGSQKT